jgi:hypothetical protein
VVGISLASACRMRFQRGKGTARQVAEVTLDPRSGYILYGPWAGASRTVWTGVRRPGRLDVHRPLRWRPGSWGGQPAVAQPRRRRPGLGGPRPDRSRSRRSAGAPGQRWSDLRHPRRGAAAAAAPAGAHPDAGNGDDGRQRPAGCLWELQRRPTGNRAGDRQWPPAPGQLAGLDGPESSSVPPGREGCRQAGEQHLCEEGARHGRRPGRAHSPAARRDHSRRRRRRPLLVGGRPVAEDRRLFERLSLEGFQAGLSWLTILR